MPVGHVTGKATKSRHTPSLSYISKAQKVSFILTQGVIPTYRIDCRPTWKLIAHFPLLFPHYSLVLVGQVAVPTYVFTMVGRWMGGICQISVGLRGSIYREPHRSSRYYACTYIAIDADDLVRGPHQRESLELA